MAEFGPAPRISSIIDNWAPYYVDRIQAMLDETWASANTWDGISTGMVGIGAISSAVPADVKVSGSAARLDRIGRLSPVHRAFEQARRFSLVGGWRSGR